jgi:molybdenum cofactor biosynthesis enzyme
MVMSKLSHYDSAGRAHMVDVSDKAATKREAEATAMVEMSAEVLAALPANPKGNPLEVARFAGIQAAKRTSELIPIGGCRHRNSTHWHLGSRYGGDCRTDRRRDGGNGGSLDRRFDHL